MADTMDRIAAALERVAVALERGAVPVAKATAPQARTGAGTVAPDSELDGKWGDPEVRYDPKRWSGDSYKGSRYSQCPASYLEELASFLDWQADKDSQSGDPQKEKYGEYKRRDAARARGWAIRNREKRAGTADLGFGGGEDPGDAGEEFDDGRFDDDLPF